MSRVSWDVDLVGWSNQNRAISLGTPILPLQFGFVYRVAPGHPMYSIWQNNLAYHDSNGDGIIEPNEISLSDPAYQGSSVPTRAIGLHNGVALLGGRLRLGALLDYRGGTRQIDNVLATQFAFGVSRGNKDPHASLAEQAQAMAASATGSSTYQAPVEDASFVRLRELSVTVAAPPAVARTLRTSSASISLLARNLWLWTRYGGTDPEINVNGNADPVSSTTVVPLPRYLVLRVNLGL